MPTSPGPQRPDTEYAEGVEHELPQTEWERRHRLLLRTLWAHVALLGLVGALTAGATTHGIAHGTVLVPFAVLAGLARLSRTGREAAVAFGLLTSSALIVHLADGAIEAHFHYFVSLVLLSLYERRGLLLSSMLYVLVQHGAMGAIAPTAVFAQGGSPWAWSAVHAAAVGAASVAITVAWRFNADLRRAESEVLESLAHQALHDDLTGLPNRRFLIRQLTDSAPPGALTGTALVLVDIDTLKVINESLGDDAGDALLRAVAARLRSAARETDVVARAGGDEFAVLIRPARTEADAIVQATRIFDALQAPYDIGGGARRVSISIGVGVTDADDDGATDVLGLADAALQRAKAAGRGRLVLADDVVLKELRRGVDIETALSHCAPDQFELRYQPIVDLSDGSIVAVEALLRWDHPWLGRVAPAEFIPVAETTGRIIEIGRWALAIAARDAVRWERTLGRTVKVYVNISANQLSDPDFVATVGQILAESGACGRHIAMELTETSLVPGSIPDSTFTALEQCGVELVLDDFGTGFSSLSYVTRFPVATIKLDRSFVSGCATDARHSVVVDAVAHLAAGLGVPALAEGIENVEQLGVVRERGYVLAQGYLFAPPLPTKAVEPLLRRHRPFAPLVGCGETDVAA